MTLKSDVSPPPAFSRPFVVDEWVGDETTVAISASEDERAEIAAAFGLPAVAALGAEFAVERVGSSRVHVRGRMQATVTRICVVSLDAFETEVSEPIDVTFAPEPEARAAEARAASETEAHGPGRLEEPPDPIIEGRIDLGALAAEFLALGLDPYPRKPGVAFVAPPDSSASSSPFAVLGELKGRRRSSRW